MSEAITRIEGRGVVVPGDDIDTDRIIPARFLKLLSFADLAEFAFYDARFDADGVALEHPLNDPRFSAAEILISGRNFGCGSSREHAPQSLFRAGFRALVAQSFAEIFFGNSLALGMPCVTVSREHLADLGALVEQQPSGTMTIEIEARTLRLGGRDFPIGVSDSAHHALINGAWDPLEALRRNAAAVREVHDRLAYTDW
jgi:3-isopropylmalate/(R)-2-methylmalate dehydratase small subunit